MRSSLERSAYELPEVYGRDAIALVCAGRRAAWANLGSGPADVAAGFADGQYVSADTAGAGRGFARVVRIPDTQRRTFDRGRGVFWAQHAQDRKRHAGNVRFHWQPDRAVHRAAARRK